jgi:carbamoyl-phosphate synthase small subunit
LTGTKRCVVTSQNHGYAVDSSTLPDGWTAWFTNANDGTNEGLRHSSLPMMSVQFHPEAMPGPTDAAYLFQEFLDLL